LKRVIQEKDILINKLEKDINGSKGKYEGLRTEVSEILDW